MSEPYTYGTWVVAVAVLHVCDKYGGSVTSWYRTQARNASLPGSVPNSKHLTAEALDVAWDRRPGSTLMAWPPIDELRRYCAPFGVQVVREESLGHDHFEYDPKAVGIV